MKNLQKKVAMIIVLVVLSLGLIGCDGIEDIKPVDGDNRTIGQMTNEATNNIEHAAECGVFNCIWQN